MRNYEHFADYRIISISPSCILIYSIPEPTNIQFVISREPVIDTRLVFFALCPPSIHFHSIPESTAMSQFQFRHPASNLHMTSISQNTPPQNFRLISCSLQSITSFHLPQSFPRKNSPLLLLLPILPQAACSRQRQT